MTLADFVQLVRTRSRGEGQGGATVRADAPARCGLCAVDADGTYRMASHAFAALFGHAPEDLLGRKLWDVPVREERRADYVALHREFFGLQSLPEVAPGLEQTGFTDVWECRDGRPIHVDCSVGLLAGHGGPSLLLLAVSAVDDSCLDTGCRAAQREHRILLEASGDAIVVIDRHTGAVRNGNLAFARLVGSTIKDVVGRPLRALDPTGMLERLALRPSVAPPEEEPLSLALPSAGGLRHVEAATVVAASSSGECAFLVLRDVTRRVRAEELLAQAHESMRALFTAAPVAIFTLDSDGIVMSWNAACERMFGWTEADAVGRLLPVVPPEKTSEFAELRRRALAGEPVAGVEVVRRRKDGSSIDVSVWAATLHDTGGGIRGLMAVLVDVTERKRAERALAASEARYRALAESASDIIFVIDRDDVVRYVNHAGARFLGVPAADIVGSPRASLFPEPIAEHQRASLSAAIMSGQPSCTELEFPERRVWLETQLVPLVGEDGRIDGVLGIARDVSARKRLEASRRNLLASVTHDLRAPLTPILGFAELMAGEDLAPSLRHGIEVIRRRAEQQLELVRELFAVATVGSGSFELHRREVDLGAFFTEYVEEAEVIVRRLVKRRGPDVLHRFRSRIDPELHGVQALCDDGRVRQVLDNLLDNAVKYSPPERVEVDIVVARRERAVEISVHDRGIGIPEGDRELVFEPFYQVRREGLWGEGMGKGLAIVKEIVSAHGGRAWIAPGNGEGACVCISLPIDSP